jgi:hypothetical protein
LLDRLENAPDDLALSFRIQTGQAFAVGRSMAHELPAALFHFIHGFGVMLADQ